MHLKPQKEITIKLRKVCWDPAGQILGEKDEICLTDCYLLAEFLQSPLSPDYSPFVCDPEKK